MSKINEAKEFARQAHAGQKRWSGADYYEGHLLKVYELTEKYLYSNPDVISAEYWDNVLVASLLHDVLEDTDVDEKMIDLKFGIEVGRIVNKLTRPRDYEYAQYIIDISLPAKNTYENYEIAAIIIKLADLEHNSSDFPVEKRNNKYSKYLLSRHILENAILDIPHLKFLDMIDKTRKD